MNNIEHIQQAFIQYLSDAFSVDPKDLRSCTPLLNDDASKAQFGDLSSNAPLVLAKLRKENPVIVSQKISTEFSHPSIEKVEIAGPGFLNFFLTQEAWKITAQELFQGGKRYFKPDIEKKKKYSVEFVSANPTGPLHVGNGRGGILGDVLGNVLSFVGHDVVKEYYINDAGAQVKKLGMSLLIRCQQLMGIEAELPEDGYQGSYLIDIAQKCVSEYGKKILEKEESFFQEYAKEHTLALIKQTLEQFGIQYTSWFSETTLHNNKSIDQIIHQLKQADLIYEHENALWFKSTVFGDDKDRVVRKASGEWTYVSADIAYMKNKIDRGADNLVMVLGQDHHSFTIRLKAIQQALELTTHPLDFILYQLVRIKAGENHARLSKRAGTIITLSHLIETVGKDVARFFFLNRKADAHLDFDLDLALKHTEENPVFYIQYAYVRIKSILARAAQEKSLDNISSSDAQNLEADEHALLKKLISLKDLLLTIATNYQVHLLAHYSVDIAHSFHHYYAKCRVIDMENIAASRARLFMLMLVKNTLETTFDIMGISKPEKM